MEGIGHASRDRRSNTLCQQRAFCERQALASSSRMIILDENVVDSQRQILLRKRIHVRQVGFEIARKGLSDENILPVLQRLRRPTLFTSDLRLYDRTLRHEKYCIAVLNLWELDFADYVLRVVGH